MEIEIYWNDLSEERQRELKTAGLNNQNIFDGLFPVATVFIDGCNDVEE
jgi:hypothetical protein